MLYCQLPPPREPSPSIVAALDRAAFSFATGWLRAPEVAAHRLVGQRLSQLACYVLPGATMGQLHAVTEWLTWFCHADDVFEVDAVAGRALFARRPGPGSHISDALIHAFEAEHVCRSARLVPTHSEYADIREHTSGVMSIMWLAQHHIASEECALAVGYANDVLTWPREQAAGETMNLCAVLGDVQKAIAAHDELVRHVEQHGTDDERAFVAGHLHWARVTGRYRTNQPL